jgi:hypothetical protein
MLAAPTAIPTATLPAPRGFSVQRGRTGSTTPIDTKAKKIATVTSRKSGSQHPLTCTGSLVSLDLS